ncbi:MAG: AI-2E family transporter [Armatimonadetes bacterium]|nr:AI-2E family transporter [Candidatus Hippobium faecium]
MKTLDRKDIIFAGIVLILVCVCVKFFALISHILLLGAMGLIFATIINRPVSFLCRKGCHRTVAAALCMLVIFGVILGSFSVMLPHIVKETEAIKENVPAFQTKFEEKTDLLCSKFGIELKNISQSNYIKQKIKESVPVVLSGITKVGISTVSVLVDTVLVILLVVYILCDPKSLIKGFLSPWNYEAEKTLRRCLLRCEKMLFAWAVGLLCGMLCMFFLTWLGLSCIGMKGAFLFASIAGFMNIIPTLGPFLAAILPLFITLVTDPLKALYVLLIYILMHQIESHVMTPMIMKKQLAIHPMILILGILVMVMFFGMIGAFLAAPFLSVLSICYEEFVILPKKKKKKMLGIQ